MAIRADHRPAAARPVTGIPRSASGKLPLRFQCWGRHGKQWPQIQVHRPNVSGKLPTIAYCLLPCDVLWSSSIIPNTPLWLANGTATVGATKRGAKPLRLVSPEFVATGTCVELKFNDLNI
jgi:hypothetical protein